MSNKLGTLALLTSGLFVSAEIATAQDQNRCAPRKQVVERLSIKYGETRQSMGLGHNNAVMEVFASSDTGTWTITVTSPHGITCLVASGQAFDSTKVALPKPEKGA